MDGPTATPTAEPLSQRIRRWGTTSWHLVGISLAVAIGYSTIAASSGLVVPLVMAIVIGTLAVPLVDRLHRHRVPRPIGALGVIVALIAAVLVVTAFTVRGIVHESGEIRAVVIAGVDTIYTWLDDLDAGNGDAAATVDDIARHGSTILTGAAAWLTTAFSSLLAFTIGGFLAMFMLYYILVDWARVRGWLAGHLAVPTDVGEAIIDDATDVVRRGFGALSLTSLITSCMIGATMLALGLPLAFAVTAVTFVTSYIPYLGAIVSGAFGFLVALGAGGPEDAVVLLVTILLVQNIAQTLIGNRLTSDRLSLHPLPSLISSVCGVALAGLMGAILSAPALALAIAVSRRVRSTRSSVRTDVDIRVRVPPVPDRP